MIRSTSRTIGLGLAAGLVAISVAACSSGNQPTWTYGPVADAGSASDPSANVSGAAVAAQGTSNSAQGATVASVSGTSTSAGAMSAGGMTAGAMSPARPAINAPVGAAGGASAPATAHLQIAIVTGDMIGKQEFPAFVPSDVTLPANSTVTITITNFDDATALPKGSEIYAKAAGIVGGTFTVTPINVSDPNSGTAVPTTLSALDPAAVSHTLTIPALGINVPIAAHARETFTITTGAPGTFTWHCMDPCGAGATGWGTAMAARKGYMEGTFTVA
ncbi:MAG TPA: hypothetical protein VF802_08310 [Candidatus Limnocylindrales bacterium]